MILDLNAHLEWVVPLPSPDALRQAVDVLLEIGTCFAVVGGEMEIRTTKRGADAIGDQTIPRKESLHDHRT